MTAGRMRPREEQLRPCPSHSQRGAYPGKIKLRRRAGLAEWHIQVQEDTGLETGCRKEP